MRLKKRAKGWTTALLAGVMVSLAVSGTVIAATGGRWEQQNNQWYYYGADGNLCTGWIEIDEEYYYLAADGHCLLNTMTPDGYYVDANGAWYVRETEILETEFKAAERFPSVHQEWIGEDELDSLDWSISEIFAKRGIRVSDEAVEYLRGEDEEVLMGIYKNKEKGGYRLDIRINLDQASKKKKQAATYDYQVFRAMIYQVTSSPELLEAAIYSSWEKDNAWNINRAQLVQVGDALVKYAASNGCGHYYIYPAPGQ